MTCRECQPRQSLPGQKRYVSRVGNKPPNKCGGNDGETTHRWRSLFAHVVHGSEIFLTEYRLPLATSGEPLDEKACAEQRTQRSDSPASMMAIIGVPPSLLECGQCHQIQLFLMRILGSARAPCQQ